MKTSNLKTSLAIKYLNLIPFQCKSLWITNISIINQYNYFRMITEMCSLYCSHRKSVLTVRSLFTIGLFNLSPLQSKIYMLK